MIIGLIKKGIKALDESNQNRKDQARRRYSLPPNAEQMYNYQPYYSQTYPQYSEHHHPAAQGGNIPLTTVDSNEAQQHQWDEDAVEYNERGKRVIPGTPYTKTSIKEMLTGGDPKELATIIVTAIILIIVILMFVFQDKIVHWLEPFTNKLKGNAWGWIIPVVIMVVLSIPPLFGHEIVLILIGVVWGLWPGWGIAAAGTVLGEIVTWFFFRLFFMNKSYKLKETNLRFAAMSRMCVEGGFIIIIIMRLSVIPAHFTTAVFAVSGVSFWVYFAVLILTTPKILVNVLIGQNFEHATKISRIFLIITIVITVLAQIYISKQIKGIKQVLVEEARAKTIAERNRAGKKDGSTRVEHV